MWDGPLYFSPLVCVFAGGLCERGLREESGKYDIREKCKCILTSLFLFDYYYAHECICFWINILHFWEVILVTLLSRKYVTSVFFRSYMFFLFFWYFYFKILWYYLLKMSCTFLNKVVTFAYWKVQPILIWVVLFLLFLWYILYFKPFTMFNSTGVALFSKYNQTPFL
jgi:hypothetical protein